MPTHIDPHYLNNPADHPDADAPASEQLAHSEREYAAAATDDERQFYADRITFWRGMIKPEQPAPLTNEQRRTRREAREG